MSQRLSKLVLGALVVWSWSCATPPQRATLVSNQESTEFRARIIGGAGGAYVTGPLGTARGAGEPVVVGRGKFVSVELHAGGIYEIFADPPDYRERSMTVSPPHNVRLSFTFETSDRDDSPARNPASETASGPSRPVITIESPSGTSISKSFVTIVITGNADAGIADVRITVNGDPIALKDEAEQTRGREFSTSQRVELLEGGNLIHAALRDRQDRLGTSALSVYRKGPADRPADPDARPSSAKTEFESGYRRRVGATIGVNRYRHWPRLERAVSDAQRMAATLRKIGFDEVFELYDGDATREKILELLGETLPSRTAKNDLVVIFFAGHGQTETLPNGRKRGYIVPVEGSLAGVFSTAISMETLRGLSERLRAKHVYYAMDSCYSGLGFTRGFPLRPSRGNYFSKVTSYPVVQMITAGMEGEMVYELGGQGIFTGVLLRALEGEADLNADGYVTAGEVASFVRPEVTVLSHNRQTPLAGTLSGSGEVVLVTP